MKLKNWTPLLLSLCLLTSCTQEVSSPPSATPTATASSPVQESAPAQETPSVSSAADVSAAPAPDPTATSDATPAPGNGQTVRVSMLKGPTGLGAAKLMDDATKGKTEEAYTFSVLSEPTEAVARISNGEVDIAALPTNLASTLYHKTGGAIQLLALNTKGVLYILENGETVSSMSDLSGKTLYATGQGANPEYILNYLLKENGLTPGVDVTVEWKASDELSALMASGGADLCMLPVPAATSVLLQNSDVRKAVSLTDAWQETNAGGNLTMGCVVVRTEFARENPQLVEEFLDDYEDSIEFMLDSRNLDEAAQLAETCGIVPKAAVAKAALPDANLIFEDGDDMAAEIQGYYQVLYSADPSSIGGSIPDGAFYYDINL